jgi:2-methylcitrate dehydratase PrpD
MNLMSEAIGSVAEEFDLATMSPEAVERAKLAVLDAIGCGFGAVNSDFSNVAWTALSSSTEGSSATVFGRAQRLSIQDAMFVNALLIHGNDFDDTHINGGLHPSSSALPCALGVAEARNLGTRDLLGGYILAVETMTRIGGVAPQALQIRGFHPTGVLAVFGCAVAAARMMGLKVPDVVNAQGIALSFASGTIEYLRDGAWTKRLHPGNAAAGGYNAARFAAHGFKGPATCYEGQNGLYSQFLPQGHAWQVQDALRNFGKPWAVQELSLKPYPSCHYCHACTDAVLALVREHGIGAGDVERMVARVPRPALVIAEKRRPTNSYEAKFSLSYCMAVAMVQGRTGMQEFEDPALLSRADIRALSDKVVCEIDEGADYSRNLSGHVTIELKDGRTLVHDERLNRGGPDRPLSREDIIEKFMGNVTGVLREEQAARVIRAVDGLDGEGSARDFAAVLSLSPS